MGKKEELEEELDEYLQELGDSFDVCEFCGEPYFLCEGKNCECEDSALEDLENSLRWN